MSLYNPNPSVSSQPASAVKAAMDAADVASATGAEQKQNIMRNAITPVSYATTPFSHGRLIYKAHTSTHAKRADPRVLGLARAGLCVAATGLEQHSHRTDLPVLGGNHQCRQSVVVFRIHRHTLLPRNHTLS